MKSKLFLKSFLVAATVSGVLTFGLSSAMAAPGAGGNYSYKNVSDCKPARAGKATCFAVRRALMVEGRHRKVTNPQAFATQYGAVAFGATALRKAYGIRALGNRKNIIAIVDANHSASAFADLSGYRAMYGLPAMERCQPVGIGSLGLPSGGNPCFVQLNQDGVSVDGTVATTDRGWAEEIALDVEMASAACPKCSILLVEANSASFRDLETAVATAAAFDGVAAISNSYGGSDFAERSTSAYLAAARAGIAVTASTGDSGYAVSAPASFGSVIAVGGTSLAVDANGRWANESAWSGAGSGCSQLNPTAVWQKTADTGCRGKSTADVASVADPSTGVTVNFEGSWYTFGGTSASSPFIAGLYALKTDWQSSSAFGSAAKWTMANRSALHDVRVGANGNCPVFAWCQSTTGWDGPTGWGTPNGGTAF